MTITSQQVDAWDAEVDAAYAAGRQEGMKQERALWELSRLGQEIEAQPERPWVGLTQQDIDIAFDDTQEGGGFDDFARAIEAKLKAVNGFLKEKNT